MGCPNFHISKKYDFNFEGISDFSSCKKVRIVNFLEPKKGVVDYSPFGVELYERGFERDSYRYSFNGMEKDDEVKGNGNSYDFGARMHDPRLGRWLSLDPLAAKYSDMSPYNFVGNMPTIAIDPDGERIIIVVNVSEKKNGKEIIIKKTLDIVLDRKILEKIAPEIISIYDLARETPTGETTLAKYEQSKTEDIYMSVVPFGDGEKASGNTSFNTPIEDGKISPRKAGNVSIEEALLKPYEKIYEGIVIDEGKKVHLVTLNENWNDKFMQDIFGLGDGAGTILHEVEFHIEYANQGVPLHLQHDISNGNTTHGDDSGNSSPGSPQRRIENEVNEAENARKEKKKD